MLCLSGRQEWLIMQLRKCTLSYLEVHLFHCVYLVFKFHKLCDHELIGCKLLGTLGTKTEEKVLKGLP